MPLGRQHYNAIANILRDTYATPLTVRKFADYLAADNPRFDRERFIAACYYSYED